MFEKMNYIKLSGVKYPFKCDILVLERIQDKYKDLAEFENKLSGFIPGVDEDGEYTRNDEGRIIGYYGEPNMEALGDFLAWTIEEGIEIEREESGAEMEIPERKKLIRSVDLAPREIMEILRKEFARCFERKNGKPTQTKSKTTEKPEK